MTACFSSVVFAAACCSSSCCEGSSSGPGSFAPSTSTTPKARRSASLLPPSLDDLVAADALARSLDAPHWTRTRLGLLSSSDRPGLERCLRALMAFLPQGDAFRSLEARLAAAPSMETVTSYYSPSAAASGSKSKNSKRILSFEPQADYGRLLRIFRRARRGAVEV